jgi:predicted transcriptional regulator
MAKNLYDAVMDYLDFMDHYEENLQAEIERLKKEIKFPELDTEKLALMIDAALNSRKDCIIVASNN